MHEGHCPQFVQHVLSAHHSFTGKNVLSSTEVNVLRPKWSTNLNWIEFLMGYGYEAISFQFFEKFPSKPLVVN